MSALAVLSLTAPAAPTAPQGTAGEDAALFQGLLNGVQGEGAPAVAPTSAGFMKTPPSQAVPDLKPDDTQTVVETAPVVTAPVATDAGPISVEGQVQGPVEAADEAAAQEAQAKRSEASLSAAAVVPLSAIPAAPASAALSMAAQVAGQPVQSGLPPPVAEGAETAAVPPPVAEDAVVQAALERAASPADAARSAQTALAAALPAAPQPLKPLNERTVKPLDAAARAGVSGASGVHAAAYAPADPVKTAASSAPLVQPVDAGGAASGSPSTPVEAAAAAVADAALPDDAEPGVRPAPLESPGAAAQTAGLREAAHSSLSRVTIDATAQIAAQILRKLEGRSTRFEMSLTPDDLGRVDVKLDIDAEGRLAARLAFDNPAAAADLRGRADELRRQLQDAGFHLADDAFEFADRDSGSSAFDRGQGGDGRQNRAFNAASRLNAEADLIQPPRWMALSLTPAGVDLKV